MSIEIVGDKVIVKDEELSLNLARVILDRLYTLQRMGLRDMQVLIFKTKEVYHGRCPEDDI